MRAPSNKQLAFSIPSDLRAWLSKNHGKAQELWVQIFKKDCGTPSVTWADCVVEAIAWGWIDGQKKPKDDASYLQRLSPRQAKSNWSQKNKEHANRLIADGRMMPPGLVHVESAKMDGRWDPAYAGPATMSIPDEFMAALEENPKAKAFFETLDRSNLYPIYYRLHTAKKPETRAR